MREKDIDKLAHSLVRRSATSQEIDQAEADLPLDVERDHFRARIERERILNQRRLADEPRETFEETIKKHGQSNTRGPALLLPAKCQIYASALRRYPVPIIADAFNVGAVTVYRIRNCREDDRQPVVIEIDGGGKDPKTGLPKPFTETFNEPIRVKPDANRYKDVAAEYDRLGHEEFDRIYFTRTVETRLIQARANRDHEKNTPRIYFNPS